jgi:hypothetical protein
MVLTLTPGPTADAGSDEAICQGDDFDHSTSTSRYPAQQTLTAYHGVQAGMGLLVIQVHLHQFIRLEPLTSVPEASHLP